MNTSQEAFILRLPDELLNRIIGEACSTLHENPWKHKWQLFHGHADAVKLQAALCLVCRRFYPIAMPYLYADLSAECYMYQSMDPDWQARAERVPKLLHRSMKQNPALWPLCRRLDVWYNEDYRGASEARQATANPFAFLAADYLTWFTGLRALLFHGAVKGRPWELIRLALENCASLAELDLSVSGSGDYSLDLAKVVDLLSEVPCPQLRVLGVNGISKEGGRFMSLKLREKAGTATFTSLRTRSFLQVPSVLEDLVRWPKALEQIKIKHTFSECYAYPSLYREWSLATLHPILAIHKSTLRRISIRCINRAGLAGFDLREFPNLEDLKLSALTTCRNREHRYTPEYQYIPNLLAPRLRIFRWDLTLEDQQCSEQLEDFAQREEDFLRAFASAAVQAASPSSLREIRVKFTPDAYVWDADALYPWDRMDAVDREFRDRGIRVKYNAPTATQEEFSVMCERKRRDDEERALKKKEQAEAA
ncbi:hypothetical protein BJY01DRAFT_229456 [Aspergillus pseudoustus]|uniref:F-box domain-containing protein n=1 Tax=Aspergillus pseudoustus TaxID=1810923 RepID=A0ABR4II75_9EURO